MKFIFSLLVATVVAAPSFAETIDFPEEELAQESVLPKFDKTEAVKNRNVTTQGKIEVSPFLGFVTTEPIYAPMKFGFNVGYHWTEESALIFNFSKFGSGLNNQYTDQLQQKYQLDFNRAPKPNYAAFVNYEYNVYYGKISLTKQGTMNLSTYPIAGLGVQAFEHKTYPALHGGVGQKFYFNKTFGFRVDLMLQYAQAPTPFLIGRMRTTDTPAPQPANFEDRWSFQTVLDLGISILL